jgi:hypothetical protein
MDDKQDHRRDLDCLDEPGPSYSLNAYLGSLEKEAAASIGADGECTLSNRISPASRLIRFAFI